MRPSTFPRLRQALADVMTFLRTTHSTHWLEILSRIDAKLAEPATASIARRELEECFGGMGSLNDLFFCEDNHNLPAGADCQATNKEFARLTDVLFRENRLADKSFFQRMIWHYYEFKHRGELPPRIKKAFAR